MTNETTDVAQKEIDEAVAIVEGRGSSHENAVKIVEKFGAKPFLAGGNPVAPTPISQIATEKVAAEPFKKCPSCGLHYPMGYDNCPQDNAVLVNS